MAKEIGIVKIVTGTVTAVAADGSKRILQAGDRVYPTDLLTTADGSTVMIQLANGSLVDMGGNDSMQLGAALAEQDQPVSAAQNTQPAGQSAEEIQAALLAGADPTAIAEATAAGAPAAGGAVGAGNEGHVPVTVDYLNPVAPVTNGFDTTGPNVAFTPIIPEVLILNPQPAGAVTGNLPPVALDDSSRGNSPGEPVTINVLGNDSDPDGTLNPASIQLVGTESPGQALIIPGQGTWSVDTTTGSITFTPIGGFTGNPTPISYTVADNDGLRSNPATVTIGYNQPPVAEIDSSFGNLIGSSVTINVLANDSDSDGTLNPASVQLAGTAGPGQPLTVAGEGIWSVNTTTGAITFSPAPGFIGNPTPINYTVADNQGLISNQAQVAIGYNQPPVAAPDSSIGNISGTSVTIDVLGNDNDPDGTLNPASVQLLGTAGPGLPLTVPGEGIWSVNTTTGAITFSPAAGFTGNPTPINYTVADNLGLISNQAQVTIGYNQPPVAAPDSSVGNIPGSSVTIGVLGNDNDPDGTLNPASVQIVGTSGPGQNLSVPGEGIWSVNTATGEITFAPSPGFEGNPTPITYTVADNLGLVSNPASVNIGYVPTFIATDTVVDESEAMPPSETGILRINGQTPTSVELTAAGATWNGATQTLAADDGSYQITVSSDTYTFTLLKALAHTNTAAPESAPIDFTFSALLTGPNGSVVNTTLTASVFDDGPTVINSNGQIQNTTAPVQSLTGLIDYDLGFDGFGAAGGVTLVNNNAGLTSRADSISYLILDSNGDRLQELYAFVDKGSATTSFADLAADRMVFSLTPTVDAAADGAYKLVLHDILDTPAPSPTTLNFDNASVGPTGQVTVGNSLVVEGSNLVVSQNHIGVNDSALDRGESLTFKFGTLVNAVQLNEINADQLGPDRFTWTAYKDGNIVGSRANVTAPANGGYTPTINVNGGYDTLKIDVTAGKFEIGGLKFQGSSPQSLQLNFGFTATDGDGDSASGTFSVETGALLTTGITNLLPELQHADSIVH